MDENEKWVRSHYVNGNPFSVPEGFFENLSDSIMGILPEQKTHVVSMDNNSWKKKIAAAVAVAASVAVVISESLTGGFSLGTAKLAQGGSVDDSEQAFSTEYTVVDEMANYAMLDNVDMYAYVATNE